MFGSTNIDIEDPDRASLGGILVADNDDDADLQAPVGSYWKNKRVLLLAATMISIVVSAAALSLYMLYHAELNRQSELLRELANSEARLIKSEIVARTQYHGPRPIPEQSLAVLVDDLSRRMPKARFGNSGEFILARRDGDQIILYRRGDPFLPGPNLTIPMQSDLAVPARLGLMGETGIVRVLDYAGTMVLAAHQPVPGYGMAVVAKINLAEVRGPFLVAALVISTGIAVFLFLVFGIWHYMNLSNMQRERTAAALRRSQARLSRAQRLARLGGWQYNFRTEEFSATTETFRLFGVTRDEANDVLKASNDLLHEEDYEAVRGVRISALKNSSDYDIDYRIVRPDGETRHIREHGTFDFDADGARVRLSGTVHDVTEQRRTEERMRQQSLIFDQIHDAVIFADVDGKILSWNKGAERQSGFNADEMIGQSIDQCIEPEDKERFWRELAPKSFRTRGAEFDVWLRHRSGSRYRGHCSIGPVRDGKGKIIGVVACTLDITEKFRAELDLLKAKRQAEAANRSKSEFLANMSHELRTPLNAILGFSQIMMAGMMPKDDLERVHEYAADIFESGTHLLNVINDLLDLAKIEAGHMDLEESRVDICDVITTSLRQVKGAAHKAGLKLINNTHPDLPLLWADERKLKQIILNLLSNAVKFTPEGGEIEVNAQWPEGNGLELSVRDTGQGMTEAEVEICLQPFGQVGETLTRDHEGTGLGLPLSVSLCNLHGGKLQIDSEKDLGTTVTIHLPRNRMIEVKNEAASAK